MGKVIAGATMSLDGFINDCNGNVDRLYPDLTALQQTKLLQDSIETTGAVVMGQHTYAMGDPDAYANNYEYQVPIFVLTHAAPTKQPQQNKKLTFTFVTNGIESAIEQARNAAGAKNVTVVGGANTIQQCLNAGLVDELQIGIMPVLFGTGLRLFEHLDNQQIELEQTGIIESPGRTDLRFRVIKKAN